MHSSHDPSPTKPAALMREGDRLFFGSFASFHAKERFP